MAKPWRDGESRRPKDGRDVQVLSPVLDDNQAA
jgi:hypothetical protein